MSRINDILKSILLKMRKFPQDDFFYFFSKDLIKQIWEGGKKPAFRYLYLAGSWFDVFGFWLDVCMNVKGLGVELGEA